MVDSPPTKRPRKEEKSAELLPNSTVLSPSLVSCSQSLRKEYLEAKPYNHGIIKNLCVDGFLNTVMEELKQNSKVKFKESDLFRVYQSIDLGNLSEGSALACDIPSLMQLKKSLYSGEFRSLMEEITGLEPGALTEQVDCAANCHTRGCHLLCHDDVIGNRKVSFIIYLTDPEPEWRDRDGGRLELYDSILERKSRQIMKNEDKVAVCEKRVPTPFPSKTILPVFNTLAYFVVSPGESFHSVQEVFCDRPRLTIQGWFHTKHPPPGIEDATLNQLKSFGKGEDTEGPFIPVPGSELGESNTLSEADRLFLANFLNETYLKKDAIDEIQKRFEEDSSVQLRHFLKSDLADRISKACNTVDTTEKVGRGNPSLDYMIGIKNGWEAVGPAHKQRFLEYLGGEDEKKDEAGALLAHVQSHLLRSAAFGRFLAILSSLGFPKGCRGKVRRFRPGLDYTVAHYGILTTKSVLDATLCFVAGDGSQPTYDEETGDLVGSDDDAIWASGDAGGFECYIAADEEDEDEADDEYNDDDDTELLSVPACFNTLSLVYRNPGTMRFVKYVGSGAPSSRWDLSLEYEIPEDDEEEDNESSSCGGKEENDI